MKLYLDSSAIVKLIQTEAESRALRRLLRRHHNDLRVTSALARVEVVRAVLPGGSAAVGQACRQLARLYQIPVGVEVLDLAASLQPAVQFRSLDTIHIASAQLLGGDLRALVTYGQRMTTAATAAGMPVAAPGGVGTP